MYISTEISSRKGFGAFSGVLIPNILTASITLQALMKDRIVQGEKSHYFIHLGVLIINPCSLWCCPDSIISMILICV
jgi:hypothetical protein